jgi:dihydroorotase
MSDRLTLLRPDDWHIHLRDGAVLPHTVGDVARTFARAIIMPNLVPPVRNAAEAGAYRQRILAARPAGSRFEPLMVLYLTDRTSPKKSARPRPAASCTPPSCTRPAPPPTPIPA